jgi:hypothetical protein
MKKIFLTLFILLILLVGALVAAPFIFKDKIVAKVKQTVNKELTAKVDFGEFSLTLFKNFPDFTLTMDDIEVVGTGVFAGDTLIKTDELILVVDILSIIQGKTISVKKVNMENPIIFVHVLKNGDANYNIVKESESDSTNTSEEESNFSVALNEYALENAHIVYDDKGLDFYTELVGLNHSGDGDFTLDLFTLNTKTSADEVTMVYEGITYINKTKVELILPLEMNMKEDMYTIKEGNFTKLNNLLIDFTGSIKLLTDGYDLDFTFDAAKSEFKNFLSMVPAVYSSEFEGLNASGKFAMGGFVKGIYADNPERYPRFVLNFLVENGSFKYPDLPTGVNNVQIKMDVQNVTGILDETVVDISQFHIELGSEPFDATLLLKTPISDPYLNFKAIGTINFDKINNILPLDEGTKISGQLVSNISATGNLSAIENQQYQNFDANGEFNLTDFRYSDKALAYDVNIFKALAKINPRQLDLQEFNAKIGKSDFDIKGKVDNYLAYVLKNEPLNGTMTMKSQLLDVNEFMGEEEEINTTSTNEASSGYEVIPIPANVTMVFNARLDRVLYDNMTLNDCVGQLIVANETLTFKNISTKTLGGTIVLNGYYQTKDVKNPEIDFDLAIKSLNVQDTYNSFILVQELAPIAQHLTGKFSAKMNMKGLLNQEMYPNVETFSGLGGATLQNAVLEGYKPINTLGDALKQPDFKKLIINNTLVQFAFENGRLIVDPFTYKQGNVTMLAEGSSGIDETIDYKMKISLPKSGVSGQASDVLNQLAAKANAQGAKVDMGNIISVNALVKGTFDDPKITLDLSDQLNDVKGTLKDAASDMLNKQKAEAEAKARAEADRLRSEAENKAKAVANKAKADAEAKAKAEAERLRLEAEKKAQEEKNRLIEEGKKKLKNKFKL